MPQAQPQPNLLLHYGPRNSAGPDALTPSFTSSHVQHSSMPLVHNYSSSSVLRFSSQYSEPQSHSTLQRSTKQPHSRPPTQSFHNKQQTREQQESQIEAHAQQLQKLKQKQQQSQVPKQQNSRKRQTERERNAHRKHSTSKQHRSADGLLPIPTGNSRNVAPPSRPLTPRMLGRPALLLVPPFTAPSVLPLVPPVLAAPAHMAGFNVSPGLIPSPGPPLMASPLLSLRAAHMRYSQPGISPMLQHPISVVRLFLTFTFLRGHIITQESLTHGIKILRYQTCCTSLSNLYLHILEVLVTSKSSANIVPEISTRLMKFHHTNLTHIIYGLVILCVRVCTCRSTFKRGRILLILCYFVILSSSSPPRNSL